MNNYEGWEKISNKYEIKSRKEKKIDEIDEIDLIIVLAGGLNEKGELHEWVIRRLDQANIIYKKYKVPILCCGGGTYHKPPFINSSGFVVHESTECVNYLLQLGVNENMIYREWSSYDTIANAFFSLTTHICFNPNIKHIGIITSQFHMKRTKAIFNWIYNLDNNKYKLNYFEASDEDLDKNMLKCRKEREEKSLQNILILKEKIQTMYQFTEWLYKEHNAYNNNFLLSEKISDSCKSSY